MAKELTKKESLFFTEQEQKFINRLLINDRFYKELQSMVNKGKPIDASFYLLIGVWESRLNIDFDIFDDENKECAFYDLIRERYNDLEW